MLIAGRIGEWTFIYDDLGETRCLWHLEQRPPVHTTAALSAPGKVAATGSVAMTGHVGFAYAVDGQLLVFHTMRMICALAGLPRTLDELRDVPLVIAPYE
ncbi:hypothetical protein KO481_25570 [Nocardia sp. NEAU-G5]|uniref:Uncharacterized protein n=1 Tax=Nocardia albiluteola TaxID=2842303 RepID=A0ABS6B660_9NOCA|nr:hypothetical protein [Nocardia albiluteola]MBU3064886.1 hypothetical protein [Nocardia albiluteola]